MIYAVFALIVAAALFYLIFPETRARRQDVAPADAERVRLGERIEAIKGSLRDMEYEKSVGKMDSVTYTRLQNELLGEWDSAEKKISTIPETVIKAEPAAKFCSSCGTAITTAAAKFCHACGAKLALWLCAVLVFFSLPGDLSAFDIRVTVHNGTLGRTETQPTSVQLLKLEQGMQPVTAKTTSGGKVAFLNLPEMTAGPYMVQAVYRGVTYSKVIPPNIQSPAEVNLDIFDSTASTDKVRVRTLVEVRRSDKETLSGLMILFFVNSDKRAFTGGADGLEFYLPETAQIEQASISVGSGSSNIQWLKLQPKPSARKGFYSVGQNVKPGDRILQVMFKMPYAEKGTLLRFQSLYPQDTGIQLIAEPENVEVKQGEKTMTRVRDENLGRGLMSFTARETQVEFSLAGGSIMDVKKQEEAEIEIKSPLSLTQKLLFPLVAVIVFAGALWFRLRQN
jgi:hypothetical protein